MSFLLYTLLGASLNILFSNLATFIFGRQDVHTVDVQLLAPVLQRYMRKNKDYEAVKLKQRLTDFDNAN